MGWAHGVVEHLRVADMSRLRFEGREIDALKYTFHSIGTTSTVQLKFEMRETERELPSMTKLLTIIM